MKDCSHLLFITYFPIGRVSDLFIFSYKSQGNPDLPSQDRHKPSGHSCQEMGESKESRSVRVVSVPATRVTRSSYQLPDAKNRWREGRWEGTDASLFTLYGGSRYQNLPTPSSLPGAAVHFACLLTLLALLCFWLLELCS